MWLDLMPELRPFAEERREWIKANAPAGLAGLAEWSTPWGLNGQRQVEEARLDPRYQEWERRLLAARLVCPQWPASVGGRDWDPLRLAVFDLLCHEAGVPRVERGVGESLVGPSILIHGTGDQQAAFLPRIISGTDVYCQGFSEPDHGSDLAAVATRGVLDGDEVVITGHKVWTSRAHTANMIFVLCRTDPAVPKHRGLSFVLVPLSAENHIEVRRIRMMNGAEEFCEDHFDGSRAPLFNVIGGLGEGWRVAMTALGYERGGEAATRHLSYLPEFWELVGQARKTGRLADPVVRQQLARAYLNVELMRFGGLRALARLAHGTPPGPLDAIGKLHWSEYHRWLGECAIDLDDMAGMTRPAGTGYPTSRWQDLFLSSRSGTIYSGTSEIQRNIIAERMLGLPKEPPAAAPNPHATTSAPAPERSAGRPGYQAARGSGRDAAGLPGFVPSPEQQEFATALRRFLGQKAPIGTARALMDDPLGFDQDVWRQMARQLGLQGLRVPERYGGSGLGFAELIVTAQELGRVLYPGPFLASAVLAAEALLASGDAAAMADLLPRLASGEAIGTLAVWDPEAGAEATVTALPGARAGCGWTLRGRAPLVLHGDVASVLLVTARTATTGTGMSLFAVDAHADGLGRRPLPALDQTRRLASVEFAGTPARLIGPEGGASGVIETVLDRAAAAVAADALGVAERSLEVTVDYAKARHQFGRPIGSFQAIKHKCADMLVKVELARSAICYAARALDMGAGDVRAAVSIAKAQCGEACFQVTAESIQIHGGMGFTWEHDAHLYFKRARANDALFGNAAQHRERLLASIGV